MDSIYTTRGEGGFSSDLALERRRADLSLKGVEFEQEKCSVGHWERIKITDSEGEKSIGRPKGCYDTLTTQRIDLMDAEASEDAANEIAKELCLACDRIGAYPGRILVLGLGNRSLTPDAIGPEAAALVQPTMHLEELDRGLFDSLDCSEIAVFSPGVTAESGIDTKDVVLGVCDRVNPDMVIAIDALASSSPERLGRTVQISDTGILPASGLGLSRYALTEATLGVPVIAIGVPTVINFGVFKREGDTVSASGDALGMVLCPKEINGIVRSSAKIIAEGINQAFGIF